MNSSTISIQIPETLAEYFPFNQLNAEKLKAVAQKSQLVRYRIGQPILTRDRMPASVVIIHQGQVRLLGYEQSTQAQVSLEVVGAGTFLGWLSLVRGVSCETAIASTEVVAIVLSAKDFQDLMATELDFAKVLLGCTNLTEVFELLSVEFQRQANANVNLKELALQVLQNTTVINLPKGRINSAQLDSSRLWLISTGIIEGFSMGCCFPVVDIQKNWCVETENTRLLGFPLTAELNNESKTRRYRRENSISVEYSEIPYAGEYNTELTDEEFTSPSKTPFVRGKGKINAPLACFQMLSQSLGVSFRRDLIRRVLENQLKNMKRISLQTGGTVAEMMGLRAQLVKVSTNNLSRLKTPVLIEWQDSFAVLYRASDRELQLAIPESRMHHYKPQEFEAIWGDVGQVLLVEVGKGERKEKFSLRWFIPSIQKHRRVLTEVLMASCFLQLFNLANPMITQMIVDKVLVQHSIDTLDVLGVLLLGVAVFEALLTNLRTYLFADTTNRIDLSLGSEVIDHLLRLPLAYFERRRIGELASRINELEQIRSFLTGTALTVVLDAIFSVIYIAVMVFYSPFLTLVGLATVPLFAILTICVSPIVRQQLRQKAERHGETQSYLVEVLSGMQTVKAQNIELKSRWHWQERYAQYISAGFKSIQTSSTASSISGFLNKLSGFLLLWAGARLVLSGDLTLGQLIAFRIIAGYVTSPLLRLIQLWQNFQETALSIERLGDVLDASTEIDSESNSSIALPEIEGTVKYTGVSFGFNPKSALQLKNINLEFPAGTFVGIVGLSGSGKSTLTKLLPRLYATTAGKIQIDDYDISKVELYSLRRQIGMVLQDTLLFNGTIHENIALTRPDASSEEVIASAKIAAAHDFIMSLPNGYNTNVGERGSALSGGQRQRIAIARTVLQNPKLLILDEATSALDYISEQQVCHNLAEAFKGRTVFFITHRLSTVKSADVILVMEQGSVVEQGTHDELMALQGYYYCLYKQQQAGM
jgi:ATP-binding cassette, subfamily B, bacterial HlyB/CyaB